MANSVDPDQMLHSAASDLGLHCFSGLSVPIFRVMMVYYYTVTEKSNQGSCSEISLCIEEVSTGRYW